MTNIIMYTTPICPYCVRAKELLKRKGFAASITEIDISRNDVERDKMMLKTGGKRTVPQIFINDQHIGGCDDLYALDSAGKLDALLAS